MSNLYPVEQVACVLVELAQAGIPPDVQELLVHGNPDRGIAPGALAKALTRVEATPAVDREGVMRAIVETKVTGELTGAPVSLRDALENAARMFGVEWNEASFQSQMGEVADAIMALHPVKQSDGLAERVREAEIADRAYERLEGHFRSLAHIARHTLECNADDVRKLEDSAEFVARYRKEQRDVHG